MLTPELLKRWQNARLIRFEASNFMCLSAVVIDIDPAEDYLAVIGPNEAGKSAILIGIAYILAGEKFKPEMPVKIGEVQSTLLAKFDNGITITLKVEEGKADKLVMASEDGAKFGSPRKILDELVEPNSFRPDEFDRLPSRKQGELCRDLFGIDTSALDRTITELRARRKDLNAVLDELKTQRDGVKLPEESTLPAAEVEVSVTALIAKRDELSAVVAANVRERDRLGPAIGESAEADRRHTEAVNHRDDLKRRLAAAEDAVLKTTEDYVRCKEVESAIRKSIAGLADPDLTEPTKAIQEVEEKNKAIRANKAKIDAYARLKKRVAEMDEAVAKKEADADDLTKQIKDAEGDKDKMLAAAQDRMPVPGMAVVGEGKDLMITVNGVPYEQLASSERTRVSFMMSYAATEAVNKKPIKIALIPDGDRIGDEKRAQMIEHARKKKILIIEERVARPGLVGVEIEAGHLKGAAGVSET